MSTQPRITGAKNKDNTGATLGNDYQTIAYAAAITITPAKTASKTIVDLARSTGLTGAVTINIAVGSSTTPPNLGDVIEIFVASDGTTRTITWGTGCLPVAATFAVTTAKYAVITAKFNGTGWVITTAISA